jgi:hypothetical protein
MKFIRPALIVALICFFAAGASLANGVHVVFDPTTPAQIGSSYVIADPTAVYGVTWGACTLTADPILPASILGDDACLAFDNNTGAVLNSFTLSFIVTASEGLAGLPLTCSSLDSFLTSATCSNAPLSVGELVTVQFSDNTGSPIPQNSNFFLAETGAPALVGTSADVTAPEPTSLTLVAAGMGLIGLCMVFAKR